MKIWVDTESGTFGNADYIVFIEVDDAALTAISDYVTDDDRSTWARVENLVQTHRKDNT